MLPRVRGILSYIIGLFQMSLDGTKEGETTVVDVTLSDKVRFFWPEVL